MRTTALPEETAKGVNCLILPDSHMPVDKNGNRADVIADPNSTVSRMIPGRVYELYMGATSRDNWQRIVQMYSAKHGQNFIESMTDDALEEIRAYLIGLYGMINSESKTFFMEINSEELRHYLRDCKQTGYLDMFYPTDNERNITDVISDINESVYAPLYDKVSYVNGKGETHTTVENVRIGVMNMLFLEKIANTYSAVSSAKVNNFGFPVKGTNLDKFRYPHSLTPTKLPGETEKRIMLSFMEPEAPADIQDLAMNPNSHKALYKHALESDRAFDLDYNIDRNAIPYGETKSLQLMHHVFCAAGFDFEHNEDKAQ